MTEGQTERAAAAPGPATGGGGAGSPATEGAAPAWTRRTGRNVAALAVARGATAVLSLVITAYLTRTLAPEAFGLLGFGLALLSYFVLLVNLGFDTLGTRDVARAPERAAALAGQITGLKLVLAVVAYAAFLAVAFMLPGSPLLRLVLAVQGGMLFAHALSVEWVYQGLERLGLVAVRNVAAAVLQLAAVLVLVRGPGDVAWAAAAATGAMLVLNGWLLATLVRDAGRLRLDARPAAWRALLPPALPIAASAFMIAIYYNLDQVMLGLMRSEGEVGLYAAGVRALTAALMPAMVLLQAFFPTLSGAWGDRAATRERMRAFAAAMVPVGLPLGVAAALLARPLLVLFAGEAFAPGAPAFAILMLNASLVYLNVLYGQPLLAWDRQRAYMLAVGGGAVVNVALNAFLIPAYGATGAAVATLAAEGAVFAAVAATHVRAVGEAYAGVLARTALATALGVVLPLLGTGALGAPLAVRLAAAAVGYGACAGALGLVPLAALRSLLRRAG